MAGGWSRWIGGNIVTWQEVNVILFPWGLSLDFNQFCWKHSPKALQTTTTAGGPGEPEQMSESQVGVRCSEYGRSPYWRIMDFRSFDSNRISILRGGILMSMGSFPEVLSQQILAGIILVGRLGVVPVRPDDVDARRPLRSHKQHGGRLVPGAGGGVGRRRASGDQQSPPAGQRKRGQRVPRTPPAY